MEQPSTSSGSDRPSPFFPETLWSLVLAAKAQDPQKAQEALAKLSQIYREPIVKFLLARGRREDAEDLANTFVLRFFLDRNHLLDFERKENAKFRSFLKTCLRRFVKDQLKKEESKPTMPLDDQDFPQQPNLERQLDSDIAKVIHQRVTEHLAQHDNGRFAELRGFLFGRDPLVPYSQSALRLGVSEGAVKVAVSRMRESYYLGFRAEVAQIARPSELDEETRYLLGLVAEIEQ